MNAPSPFKSASYERTKSAAISMLRTLKQRLRIIAPLVISAYNNLRSQICAPVTLPNYVHMHVMNSSF